MRTKLKTFGLAACAVFAFSAMIASGASAQVLTTDGNTVIGEELGSQDLHVDVGTKWNAKSSMWKAWSTTNPM